MMTVIGNNMSTTVVFFKPFILLEMMSETKGLTDEYYLIVLSDCSKQL